jgi:DNA-binding MarR family transcriptional regulator
VEQRWQHVEQPILEALAARDGASMSGEQLAEATGVAMPALMRALRSLKEDDYIDGVLTEVDQEDYPVRATGIRLLPKGLRQAGLWPSEDAAVAFIAALENAIRDEPDEQQRSKLQRARDALKAVGTTTLNTAITTAMGIGAEKLLH